MLPGVYSMSIRWSIKWFIYHKNKPAGVASVLGQDKIVGGRILGCWMRVARQVVC